MPTKKQVLEFTADFFNKIVTLAVVLQFFLGQEIGILQLAIVVIGLLLDFIAKFY